MANECFLSLSFSALIIMARRRGVYESKAVTRAGGRKKREKRKKIIVLWVTLPRRSKYLRAEVRVHLNADTPGGRFPLSAEATANVNLFSGLPLPWFHRRIFHSSFWSSPKAREGKEGLFLTRFPLLSCDKQGVCDRPWGTVKLPSALEQMNIAGRWRSVTRPYFLIFSFFYIMTRPLFPFYFSSFIMRPARIFFSFSSFLLLWPVLISLLFSFFSNVTRPYFPFFVFFFKSSFATHERCSFTTV